MIRKFFEPLAGITPREGSTMIALPAGAVVCTEKRNGLPETLRAVRTTVTEPGMVGRFTDGRLRLSASPAYKPLVR